MKKNTSVLNLKKINKGMIESKFDLLPHLFTSTGTIIGPNSIRNSLNKTIAAHNKIICNYGVVLGTKRWKAICNHAICKLEHREPAEPSFSLGKKDGWPTVLTHLRPFRDLFHSDNSHEVRAECYRYIITVLKINSVCRDNNFFDVNDIQKTFSLSKELEEEFTSYLSKRLAGNVVIDNISQLLVEKPVLGPANGPNGIPKLQSATAEAIQLLSSDLAAPFKEYCEITGNNEFLDYMEDYSTRDNLEDSGKLKKDRILLRKLTSIADKGNKSRVVAICDFWTQTLLGPLEKLEMQQLSLNFKDKSSFFSHSEGFKKVLSEYDERWLSIDASQWTDNFPSRLQYLYLKARYGKRLAYSWRRLVVDCKWNIGNSADTVMYGKGQGMGTKGSFMIASVTDHYFIEFISQKFYGKVNPYNKVGDDLVIQDEDKIFLREYPKIGVDINISKTKCSTTKGSFVEYVSRIGWDKDDVSQISPNLIQRIHRQPLLFPVLIKHIKERRSNFSSSDALSLIQNLSLKTAEVDRLIKLTLLHQSLTGEILIDSPTPDFQDSITNLTVLNCLCRLIDVYENSIESFWIQKNKYTNIESREKGEALVNEFLMSEQTLFGFARAEKLEISNILLLTMSLKRYNDEQADLSNFGQIQLTPRLSLGYDLHIKDHKFSNMIIDMIIIAEGKRLSTKLIDQFTPQSPKNVQTNVFYLKALNKVLLDESASPLTEDAKFTKEYLGTSSLKNALNREVPSVLVLKT